MNLREIHSKNKGWFVVGATCLMLVGVGGFIGSFGNLVQSLIDEFGSTEALTSFVGSLTFGLGFGLSPVSFIVMKKIGTRFTCLIGVLFYLTGQISSSFVTNIYLLLFTFSVMIGIGGNLIFNPALILVGSHFKEKNQGLATCLATAGLSIGNLGINPLLGYLVDKYKWRIALRIICAYIVSTTLISIIFFSEPEDKKPDEKTPSDVELQIAENETKEEEKKEEKTKLSTPRMLINPGVFLWIIATILWNVSFVFPFVFIIKYTKTTFGVTTIQANSILIVFAVFAFIGRFVGGFCSEQKRINLTHVYAIFTTLAGVVTIVTVPINNFYWMYFYAVCCGVTSGQTNSMIYVTTHKLFGSFYGNRIWTYVYVGVAIGAVVGPTLAGALFDATLSYDLPFYFAGSCFIASAVVMVATKMAVDKYSLK